MSKPITPAILKRLIAAASRRLTGRWLLVGGCVLPYLGRDVRSTIDIDLVGLGEAARGQRLALMELAEEMGLLPEVVNSAADFFIEKLKPGKEDLILVAEGKSQIYRPSATFYILSKLARLAETDLKDCEEIIRWARKRKESIDEGRIRQHAASLAKKKANPEWAGRVKRLLSQL